MKFASIDIGSNAVRLLFMNVFLVDGNLEFSKSSIIRVPLRLGEDVFSKGKTISEEKLRRLVTTMISFRGLIEVNDVVRFKACATSAMREAVNAKDVVERVQAEAGVKIEVIEGQREAEMIFSNHVETLIDSKKCCLYVDIGGGSTELSLFDNKKMVASRSFDIGTVRILQHTTKESEWMLMRSWIKSAIKAHQPEYVIGSGGNINKLFKMVSQKKKINKFMSYKQLEDMRKFLAGHTIEERIIKLGLNHDRADVIIPAADTFLTIMRWCDCQDVYVPKVGLADGIIHQLASEYYRVR